jgi:hypothetical protein
MAEVIGRAGGSFNHGCMRLLVAVAADDQPAKEAFYSDAKRLSVTVDDRRISAQAVHTRRRSMPKSHSALRGGLYVSW